MFRMKIYYFIGRVKVIKTVAVTGVTVQCEIYKQMSLSKTADKSVPLGIITEPPYAQTV